MKGQIDTQYGKVLVEDDVIATYAGSVAVECLVLSVWQLLI